MRKLGSFLILVIMSVLFLGTTVFANTGRLVTTKFDKEEMILELNTQAEGEIVYAFKVGGGYIEDINGNVLSDGKDTANWGMIDLEGEDIEGNLYTDDKDSWSVYNGQPLDVKQRTSADEYILFYTAIKYVDGTYSETENEDFYLDSEITINTEVIFGSENRTATIKVNVVSNNPIESISNNLLGKTVENSNTAEFVAEANGTHIIYATDILGATTHEVVRISDIEYEIIQITPTPEDRVAPIITFEGVETRKDVHSMLITVKAADSGSGIDYITLPSGAQENATEAQYIIGRNGTYEFSARDRAGNEVNEVLVIDNIAEASESTTTVRDSGGNLVGDNTSSGGKLPQTGGLDIKRVVVALVFIILSGIATIYIVERNKKKVNND